MRTNRVFVTKTRASRISKKLLEEWGQSMLDSLGESGSELSIVLCDDSEIRRLNRTYAREDHATDVLAFASSEAPGAKSSSVLGDIVISLETAGRQARARGGRVREEVLLLLAHGLLHLLGHDHRTKRETAAMEAKTAELIRVATKRRPVSVPLSGRTNRK